MLYPWWPFNKWETVLVLVVLPTLFAYLVSEWQDRQDERLRRERAARDRATADHRDEMAQ